MSETREEGAPASSFSDRLALLMLTIRGINRLHAAYDWFDQCPVSDLRPRLRLRFGAVEDDDIEIPANDLMRDEHVDRLLMLVRRDIRTRIEDKILELYGHVGKLAETILDRRDLEAAEPRPTGTPETDLERAPEAL